MTGNNIFDVIIIGGSYSGLAAGMALGRSLRKVLIIDSGEPCNRQTPHSHNFLTQDGSTPQAIAVLAKEQVSKYETVHFFNGFATNGIKNESSFSIEVATGEMFHAKKLLFATGIRDIMPGIKGFAECWGISVLHCPYCHGYEVRNELTGVLGNGDGGFEFAQMISNWTPHLTLFTNGVSALTEEQANLLAKHDIAIVTKEVDEVLHEKGRIQHIRFKDGSTQQVKALYARLPFEQHSSIPELLGCALTPEGFIQTDALQATSVKGIYASGDNASRLRSVANAVATGTAAGAMMNREMIMEGF